MNRLGSSEIEEAARLLLDGGVIAIPTDTVYGLAACVEQPAAVRDLFVAKARPESVALPVLVPSVESADELVGGLPADARRLASAFWPGALTMVLACEPSLAALVGAADATVGVRVPDDPIARALLERTGPLAVSSANLHGSPPCTSADEVEEQLRSSKVVVVVLDGGHRSGTPSTVARLDGGDVQIVRPGPITEEDLTGVLNRG